MLSTSNAFEYDSFESIALKSPKWFFKSQKSIEIRKNLKWL